MFGSYVVLRSCRYLPLLIVITACRFGALRWTSLLGVSCGFLFFFAPCMLYGQRAVASLSHGSVQVQRWFAHRSVRQTYIHIHEVVYHYDRLRYTMSINRSETRLASIGREGVSGMQGCPGPGMSQRCLCGREEDVEKISAPGSRDADMR